LLFITPAIITGSVAVRMKFKALFIALRVNIIIICILYFGSYETIYGVVVLLVVKLEPLILPV
jgi:ammonia channel protein AmtB